MTEYRRQESFSPVPTSAAEARRMASQALREWGLGAAEEAALLVVTELTSNGVRHAKTRLDLSLTYGGSRLRIELSDHDKRLPTLCQSSAHTHRGWGLRLINTLSSDWGTIVNGDGKTVWVDLEADKLWSPPQLGILGDGIGGH